MMERNNLGDDFSLIAGDGWRVAIYLRRKSLTA